jgi:hypothetical protein
MKVVCILLVLIPFLGLSQQLKFSTETKLITFERVEDLDSMKANLIFSKAKEWLVTNSATISGEVSPTLIKSSMVAQYPGDMGQTKYLFDVTLKVKDGAVKVIVDNYKIFMSSGNHLPVEGQFIDAANAIAKGKKIPTGLQSGGNEFTEKLVKYIRAKSDF